MEYEIYYMKERKRSERLPLKLGKTSKLKFGKITSN